MPDEYALERIYNKLVGFHTVVKEASEPFLVPLHINVKCEGEYDWDTTSSKLWMKEITFFVNNFSTLTCHAKDWHVRNLMRVANELLRVREGDKPEKIKAIL